LRQWADEHGDDLSLKRLGVVHGSIVRAVQALDHPG
jgi:hypothetical protein